MTHTQTNIETLSTGIVQIGGIYEAYLSLKIDGKSIWCDFSGIKRNNENDARNDCKVLAADFLAMNKIA